VSSNETPDDQGGGVLSGLLSPLRVPERLVGAAEAVAEAVQHLGPMRAELVRLRRQTTPLGDLLPALEGLKGELVTRLDALRKQTKPLADVPPALEALRGELVTGLDVLRKQTKPLGDVPPALEDLKSAIIQRLDAVQESIVALEGNESHLNQSVRDLGTQLAAMHTTLQGLQSDVQRVTERLPDPDAPGPLDKARDFITGGD